MRIKLMSQRMVRVNTRPFADWLADVSRRMERRTGRRLGVNDVASSYWEGQYHCGIGAWEAADLLIEEQRNA